MVQEEQVPNIFRYSGEYWDAATNLQYLRARWYDPSIGRFINEDTYEGDLIRPTSQNLYTYVENNPLGYIDPSGNYCVSSDGKYAHAGVCSNSSNIKDYYMEDVMIMENMPFISNGVILGEYSDGGKSLKLRSKADREIANFWSLMTWDEYREFVVAMPLAAGIWTASNTSGGVKGSKSSKQNGCNCFTAGTKVQTDKGEKNIEDIEVGDKVLAKDENNSDGELAYKEVENLYRNQRDDIIKLYVENQIVETTDNHPFWVEDKGWVFADELQVGDKLQKADGSNLNIEKVEFVKLDRPVTVYNFTVADYHTYYVTDLDIWVHNTKCLGAQNLNH